jgi:hypothetical protein
MHRSALFSSSKEISHPIARGGGEQHFEASGICFFAHYLLRQVGRTPLHSAGYFGAGEGVFQVLLASGANANTKAHL